MPSNAIDKPSVVAVIGGGIAGLSAAFRLQQDLPDNYQIRVFDSAPRMGGVLHTEHVNGLSLEHSADMFSVEPSAAMDLCQQLGIESELLTARATQDRAYVATNQGMQPIPQGFSLMLPGNVQAVLDSHILSEQGKQRFLQEESIPANTAATDESLQQFAVRRFGLEVFERLIQPLASGIYTADPTKLSMSATMDRFRKLEQKYGSLIAAGRATAGNNATSGARYGLFRAPQLGIGYLVEALSKRLLSSKRSTGPDVTLQTSTHVESVSRVAGPDGMWQVDAQFSNGKRETIPCAGVIAATPSFATAGLISPGSDGAMEILAKGLSEIEFASSAIVVLVVDRAALQPANFAAYGIVIPTYLNRDAIAISISSNKFTHRCPEDQQIIRVFFGGALRSELVDLDDTELVKRANEECKLALGLSQAPSLTRVIRWRRCMPQYTLGHIDRVAELDQHAASLAGFELAGKSYHGVGIPACVESGFQAAERLIGDLAPLT